MDKITRKSFLRGVVSAIGAVGIGSKLKAEEPEKVPLKPVRAIPKKPTLKELPIGECVWVTPVMVSSQGQLVASADATMIYAHSIGVRDRQGTSNFPQFELMEVKTESADAQIFDGQIGSYFRLLFSDPSSIEWLQGSVFYIALVGIEHNWSKREKWQRTLRFGTLDVNYGSGELNSRAFPSGWTAVGPQSEYFEQ